MNKNYLLTPIPYIFIIFALTGGIDIPSILVASKVECLWSAIVISLCTIPLRFYLFPNQYDKEIYLFIVDIGTIFLSAGLSLLIYDFFIISIGISCFIIWIGASLYIYALVTYHDEKKMRESIPEMIRNEFEKDTSGSSEKILISISSRDSRIETKITRKFDTRKFQGELTATTEGFSDEYKENKIKWLIHISSNYFYDVNNYRTRSNATLEELVIIVNRIEHGKIKKIAKEYFGYLPRLKSGKKQKTEEKQEEIKEVRKLKSRTEILRERMEEEP